MNKWIIGVVGGQLLSLMAAPAVADYDAQMARKQNAANQKELIENQCGPSTAEDRQFSTLLGPPSNYADKFPVMGPLAGELESIPPFAESVVPQSFAILEQSARRRFRMLESRGMSRVVYENEKEAFEPTGYSAFSQRAMGEMEQTIQGSIDYISGKAVEDVQGVLGNTIVWVKRPYEKSMPPRDLNEHIRGGGDPRIKTHIPKKASVVMDECRRYWAGGFNAVRGSQLMDSHTSNQYKP